jgi:hypothetical protein
MVKLINAFGDFRIEQQGLAHDYQLLLEAYVELRRELDIIRGGADGAE